MIITEGKARLKIDTSKKISKEMSVFYNPAMELNRTISVLLLNSLDKQDMQLALPLAGSGIRGIRFLLELKKDRISSISLNDYSDKALKTIRENIELNKIKQEKIILSNHDANIFLSNSKGFDYIDIDPFGTPNPFLDSAVKRLAREGILAVTATDTSALSGTYPKACQRKYWARPLRKEIMHEIGLRILIRKCQLVAAQYDKALTPIYSYSKEHYMRVFFSCQKGKAKVDNILKKHDYFQDAGPLWTGKLWDRSLARKICSTAKELDKQDIDFLKNIESESNVDIQGFYHIPTIIKEQKLKQIPKQEKIISKIISKGYKVSKTHFKENSLRTDIPKKELLALIKKI